MHREKRAFHRKMLGQKSKAQKEPQGWCGAFHGVMKSGEAPAINTGPEDPRTAAGAFEQLFIHEMHVAACAAMQASFAVAPTKRTKTVKADLFVQEGFHRIEEEAVEIFERLSQWLTGRDRVASYQVSSARGDPHE